MGGLGCFNLQERLLPYLRAQTARRLADRGLRQTRIAEHLGVSQAMVSKYLRSSVRPPAPASAAALEGLLDDAVGAVLEEESKGRVSAWCPLCPRLGSAAAMAEGRAGLERCLRGDDAPASDDSRFVLDNLREAAARIRGRGFARLAPEVNINLAMALADARDARGVAAFPGRLVEIRGDVRAVAEPQFGASKHLSSVLLRVRRTRPSVRAVVCLRDDEAVRRALKALGLRVRVLARQRRELVVALPRGDESDALLDPGAFGIEPITYLLGESAVAVVERAERLARRLEREPPSSPATGTRGDLFL